MAHAVIHIKTAEQFEALIKEGKVVVDFFATWCGPCKKIAPEIEKMAAENPDVKFAKVDVDELEDVAAKQGVTAMPTFKFFNKGQEFQKPVLGADGAKIRAQLEALKAA